MFSRTKSDFWLIMAASLALLGVLKALKIDSSLAIIKNDCYERLAIGQRHNSKDIYKTSHVTTVFECQLFCTEEKELCKSFSFGIGVKGNASCEVSANVIKETADLKPIGTKADTDYDLYIKKLGCTIVIDKNNPAFDHYNKPQNKPSSSYDKLQTKPVTENENPNKPSGYDGPPSKPSSGYDGPPSRPPSSGYDGPPSKPSSGYDGPSNKPGSGYGPPSKPSSGYGSTTRPVYGRPQEEGHITGQLVSVSTGPKKPILNPYLDILVGDGPYNYARPPFRPPALNHPYDKPFRPRPDDYGSRPIRPDYDSRPGESNHVSYGNRPIPDKYGSYIPRPDHYGDYYKPRPDDFYRPKPNDDYRPNSPEYFRPRPDEYRPRPPVDEYGQRPLRPQRPSEGGYERPHRPDRPVDFDRLDNYGPQPPKGDYDRPNNYRPKPPIDDYDRPNGYRPKPPNGDYNRPNNYGPKPPSGDYDRPNNYGPQPPKGDYDRPNNYGPKPPSGDYDRPNNYGPQSPTGDYDRPNSYPPKPSGIDYERPNSYGPKPPTSDYDRPSYPPKPPGGDYDRPNPPKGEYYQKPSRPENDYNSRPNPPYKPTNEYLFHGDIDRYDQQPEKPSKPSQGYQKPDENPLEPNKPTNGYDNSIKGTSKPKDPHSKPIVTQSVGAHGESITSIITELENACFRRVLAGKRVTRALVKRALFCERIEDCQRECAEEKRFACEGFNYRLDPTGRGKGECELLEIPLSHLDIGRDLYPDPDYDYYERDRNAATANCKEHGYYPSNGYDGYYNRRHDQRPDYDWGYDERRYGNRRPPSPDYGYDSRPPYGYEGYRPNGNRRGDFAYHDSHHSEHSHNYHYEHYDHAPPPPPYDSYEPYLPPNRRPNYDDRYFHTHYVDRGRDKNYGGSYKPSWGSYGGSYGTNHNPHDFERRNYYLPPPAGGGGNKNWGQYGGNYGNGGANLQYSGYGHSQSFDFWGLNKFDEKGHGYGEAPSRKPGGYLPERPSYGGGGSYLPEQPYKPPGHGGNHLPERPTYGGGGGSYLPEPPYKPPSHGGGGSYLPEVPLKPNSGSYLPDNSLKPPFANGGSGGDKGYLPERPQRPPPNGGGYLPGKPPDGGYNNAILPAEPRYPYRYDFLKDECSLRTAAGFRLTKGLVKKFVAVPNIYECEILCFKEKDFPCASYAYRYTTSAPPIENCYLSNRNYKELDFYTDLEPDRNFDVYTMNNMKKCEQPVIRGKDDSDCFWRVRSAQRLDHTVVRDSLTVKSIVECQIECLRSHRFTCRAFSFRYGSPVIGGSIDNCILTDWPYNELDPRHHFIPEPGFEIYERGSFGHGCEPDHFGIKGKPWKNPGTKIDQLCYIGFGSPVTLLRQSTKKELQVATEEECKAECSKFRENTLFQCMSLSYSTKSPKWEPNCKLSDILQRDLLPNVDFIPDQDSWLFAWDNYNPECRAIANEPVHNHIGPSEDRHDNMNNALGTWRVYSVSGWPCRRGTLCRENRIAGFWYCELEGGDSSTWDYCCRPDHQCGFSPDFPYQWCYVGPERTQWRKCSDRYYPYIHNLIDRFDPPPPPQGSSHWVPSNGNNIHERPPPYRPGVRPDRPPAPPTPPPPRPSLDEYEMQFQSQFLDPPRPGGFGQPRHWPLSYLHKERPPNSTDSDSRLMKATKGIDTNPKFAAIQNLIDVIKSNDLKNIEYQISNESNKADDILFVKIPLPTNFTQESKKNEKIVTNNSSISEPIDLKNESKNNSTKRSQKSLPAQDRLVPTYRRGFITRTNVTNHRRSSRTL